MRRNLRPVFLAVAAVILLAVAASCTPEEQALYASLPPEARAAVDAHLQREAAPAPVGDCYSEMRRVFPASTWSWAERIIHRESRNNPAAQNPRSSAAGCFQMLRIHAHRFAKVGGSWGQRYNARVNVLAAYDLYREAGTSPWRVA